jgi:ABC-2 type transport system permease protein
VNVFTVVFTAEFIRRIKSRPFLIATVIGALSVVALALLPTLVESAMGADANRIILIGDARLTSVAAKLLAKDFAIDTTQPALRATPDAAYLEAHGKSGAAAVLRRDRERLRVTIYARDPSAFGAAFGRDLAPLQLAFSTGMSVADIQRHATVAVEVRGVGGRFRDASAANMAKGIAYLFVFLLYIAILLNAQAIMASVAEEKTSRIAELLVATIDPTRLLTAKILAAAACGAIQLSVWVAVGGTAGGALIGFFGESSAHRGGSPLDLGPIALPPAEIFSLLAFFLVGFFQYSVLYAAAASLINRTEDLGSVAGPLVIPVVIGFVLAQFGLQSPNSLPVAIFSQIPLLAPFVMFTRIAVTNVPVWQVALSLTVNIAAAVALAWLAGKVYRFGLLLYGRPPSLKQIVNILRT